MSVFVRQRAETMTYTKDSWTILNPIEQSIKAKIEKYGTPLKNWNVNIYRGVLTGCNEAFIISGEKRAELIEQDPKSAEIIRPILRGRDIKRYGYEFADLWLICTFPSRGYNIHDYLAVKNWLANGDWTLRPTKGNPPTPIGTGLLRLEQNGTTHILNGISFKSRKKTSNKWFETQDSISYWNDFSKQKIMYSEIVQTPRFFLDNEGKYFPEATTFILTGEMLEFLLMALHSKVLTYAFKSFYAGGGLGENGYRYKKAFLEKLPVFIPTKVQNEQCKEWLAKKQFFAIEKILHEGYHFTSEEIKLLESTRID